MIDEKHRPEIEKALRESGDEYYTDEDTGYIYPFYKKNKTDKIWWVDFYDRLGAFFFTFDKKKFYSIFGGLPENDPRNMSEEEKEIFIKENPEYEKFVR